MGGVVGGEVLGRKERFGLWEKMGYDGKTEGESQREGALESYVWASER